MKRCVLILLALLALPVAGASAGTYDVVSCNAPGSTGVNGAWSFETFNASGRAAPDPAKFALSPLTPDTCSPANGIILSTAAAKATVGFDDGAAWVFRAPAGRSFRNC